MIDLWWISSQFKKKIQLRNHRQTTGRLLYCLKYLTLTWPNTYNSETITGELCISSVLYYHPNPNCLHKIHFIHFIRILQSSIILIKKVYTCTSVPRPLPGTVCDCAAVCTTTTTKTYNYNYLIIIIHSSQTPNPKFQYFQLLIN